MNVVRAIVAWFAAVAAATVALLAPLLVWDAAGRSLALGDVRGAVAMSFFVAVFMGAITALPWTGLVWLGRVARAPRGLWDAGAGAAMGPALFLLIFQRPLTAETLAVVVLFGFSGGVGGFVYWAVAGRPRRTETATDTAAAFE